MSEVDLSIHYPYAAQQGNQIHLLDDDIIHCQGRFFVRAHLGLPLRPGPALLDIATWVEIDRPGAGLLVDAFADDQHDALEMIGRLGADLPGLEGIIGAETTISKSGGQGVEITGIVDSRLPSSEKDLESIFALLGSEYQEDQIRHQAIRSHGEKIFARSCYWVEVQAPPESGITAQTKVLVAPPHDTGQPASVLTIGSSDFLDDQGRPEPEILGQFVNPPPELINCFGDFSVLSHLQTGMLCPGTILGEKYGVPGSEEMAGWILADPFDLTEEQALIDDGHGLIPILQAVPLYQEEIDLALSLGPERLISLLSEADVTDLRRPSVSEPV